MEINDYIRIIKQRGWLIVLLTVLTAVTTFGISSIQTPVYVSNLTLLVNPSRTDFGQAQAAKVLLRGYESWMRSSLRAGQVIDILNLDMTPGELLGKMSVSSDDSRFIINVQIEDTNGDVANDIARVWGDLLILRQNDINAALRKEDRIFIEFIDNPVYGLDRPRVKINTAAGAVFGALLGVVVVFLLEWLESGVVRRSQDVEKYLDIPVIGSIPGNN